MAQKERLEYIVQIVRLNKKVFVTKLSEKLEVTPETIRRDLERLEAAGLVKRIYGGAVLREEDFSEKVNFLKRAKTNINEKQRIAVLASEYVPANASIGCDASSTAQELLAVLGNREDLLVLTNSAKAVKDLDHTKYRLLSTGGYVNRQSYSLQGIMARNVVQGYHLDMVFIGCRGIRRDGGIFDSHEMESDMKKMLIEHGNRVYLLADHTKFDCVGLEKTADLTQIDAVITDRKPSEEWMRLLKEKGVEVCCP